MTGHYWNDISVRFFCWGDLFRERRIKSASDVNRRQFLVLPYCLL